MAGPPNPPDDGESEEIKLGWQMAALGFQVSSEAIAGALIGWLYDYWRGSGHTGVLVGSLVGVSVGLVTLIRRSLQLNRRLDAIARQRRQASGPIPPLIDPTEDDDDDPDRLWNERWNDRDADDANADDASPRPR